MAYSPERVQSELETTPVFDSPAPSGSGLGVVVAVAAVALGLGLGGGLYALQRYDLRPKDPVSVPSRTDHVPSEPRLSPAPRRGESSEPATRKEATPGFAENVAEASQVGSATPRIVTETPVPKEPREPAPVLDAGAKPAATQPDAGWVKPAWAIPDPEPKRIDDLDEPRER